MVRPILVLSSPSTIAAADLASVIGENAPGWSYKVRLDGARYADAPSGWARLPSSSLAGLAMNNDTIIHVASMSKPVCVTAFVAMLEDWQALADGVQGRGSLAALTRLILTPASGWLSLPTELDVPNWLAPAFSSVYLAQNLLSSGLGVIVPSSLSTYLEGFAGGEWTVQPSPPVPPGYAGLITKVSSGAPIPNYGDKFLPLVKARLQTQATRLGVSYVEGSGVADVTIEQLITHNATLRDGITDNSIYAEIPSAQTNQPSDGSHAAFDLWSYMLAFLRQDADGSPGYKNDDYTVLGSLVEDCTGTLYDDFVYARLFSDPRFDCVRRYVVDSTQSAYYYAGVGPTWTGGVPFPDYSGWSAAGGFYYTANQITDWLYALYSGSPVRRASGIEAPLLSNGGLDALFGARRYFVAGANNSKVGGWTTYWHNGATSVDGGSSAGKLGLATSPSGMVMTAFCCANGAVDYDTPFDTVLPDMVAFTTTPWFWLYWLSTSIRTWFARLFQLSWPHVRRTS